MPFRVLAIALSLFGSTAVWGHASSQQLVLLLPTDVYNTVGVAIVTLTVLFLAVPALANRLTRFSHGRLLAFDATGARYAVSLASFALLAVALVAGLTGSRDPLTNPLPLLIWSVWWVILVVINGLLGNLWRWLNPWSGMVALLTQAFDMRPVLTYPTRLGHLPALAGFLLFSAFLLAHPAPDDPAVLASVVALYWLVTLIAMLLFGEPAWRTHGEFASVLMTQFSHSALLGSRARALHIGLPGWQLSHRRDTSLSLAVFVLLLLGTSSFDGFNETFFWLGLLGVNPLEFPGRSAVIPQTLAGIAIGNALLIVLFSVCVVSGLALARARLPFLHVFASLAPTLLPIAVGYHFAHYLTTILVTSQYTLASLNDPFASGWRLLGFDTFYVTTGFFNTPDSVARIFFAQATAVVLGHVVSLLSAHRVMASLLEDNRKTVLSQLPLAAFMVAYTLFGLWLLSAPRGA
ncbi:MAG: hypothetical protein AAF460_04785 [Pseudomonadota bacterium]